MEVEDNLAAREEEPEISAVIPVFNEEASLPHLAERLENMFEALGTKYEVILVDDGSTDGSVEKIKNIVQSRTHFRALYFRRNFGQTAALDAGFKNAKGTYVVALDADLQNDPDDIPAMLEKAQSGIEVVKGWRKKRKDRWLTRVLPSKIANRIIGWVTGLKLHDYGCTLTLFKRDVLQEINLYGEMHRFIPVFAQSVGASIEEIPVQHHPRQHGKSKYNLTRTFRVLLDLITVRFLIMYNTKPLYFFGKFAFASLFFCLACWTWTVVKRIMWGYPLYTDPFFIFGGILLVLGIQLLLMGLLAEMMVRIYYESQGKNSWILKPDQDSNERQT
jgi:glycosyltransferase involved in cell wall biosynthesis